MLGELFRILLWGFVLYYAYKFVFGVVVPVGKATNQMKNKIKEMQEQQSHQQQQAQQQPSAQAKQQSPPTVEGDYIEFEEVKQ